MTPATSTSTMPAYGASLPAMPEDTTALPARLLARLIRGAELTSADWLREAHASRLAATVHTLRRAGWIVIGERVTVPTCDGGRMASVARYSLDPDQRAAATWSHEVDEFLAAVDAFEASR